MHCEFPRNISELTAYILNSPNCPATPALFLVVVSLRVSVGRYLANNSRMGLTV